MWTRSCCVAIACSRNTSHIFTVFAVDCRITFFICWGIHMRHSQFKSSDVEKGIRAVATTKNGGRAKRIKESEGKKRDKKKPSRKVKWRIDEQKARDHIRMSLILSCATWKLFLHKCDYIDDIKNSNDEFSNEELKHKIRNKNPIRLTPHCSIDKCHTSQMANSLSIQPLTFCPSMLLWGFGGRDWS